MFQSIDKRAKIFIASAKTRIISNVEHFCTSLRQILNKRGPRAEPWGTPFVNSSHERNAEFIFLLCHLFVR